MPQYKETRNDLERKYANSYVKYKDDIWLVRGFGGGHDPKNPDAISALLQGKESKEELITISDSVPWVDLMPNSQYFNIMPYGIKTRKYTCRALFLYLRARRQWIRSLSGANAALTFPHHSISVLYSDPLNELRLAYPLVEAIYAKYYFPYEEAIERVAMEASVAISPDFCLCIHPIVNDFVLLRNKHGFIAEANKKEINVYHLAAYQEVVDMVNRSRLNVVVNKCHSLPNHLTVNK